MQQVIPGPKARRRYWKRIINLQNTRRNMRSTFGKPLPVIKKGSKKYEIIMELARMPTPELIEIAEEYYGDYKKIRQLLRWYEKGTLRQERKKEGRKFIPITLGFPPRSKFIGHLIRHQIINFERGMIALKKMKGKVKKGKKGKK